MERLMNELQNPTIDETPVSEDEAEPELAHWMHPTDVQMELMNEGRFPRLDGLSWVFPGGQ
jgi:hypothetical protein